MIQESLARPIAVEAAFNPFPGLRPFEFHESHLFFGRDGQSERLIEKLSRSRFLAVVGSSGSGKSSLVRAGLLPALLGGMMTSSGSVWHVALLRPGNNPIGNLAGALCSPDAFGSEEEDNRQLQIAITEATLRRGNLGLIEAVRQANMPPAENLLVIADQFEELFRVEPGAKTEAQENHKAAFVKLLLAAASQRDLPIYVVLTMRSDYLGDCAQFQDLPEAINEGQYLIPRMTREQRREAITGPIAVGGADITPRLVNRLLNDVGDNPDQLPILQHALMRAWDEWQDKRPDHKVKHEGDAIDLCCYEQIGGMENALSRHADEAYHEVGQQMGERGELIAEKMFKALTEKGADNREVRRPVTLSAICAVTLATEAEVIAVIESFRAPGRSFLMPPAEVKLNAESLIDISHESLIRNWKRLSEWVAEETRSARIYLRLAETAALHQEHKAGLWRDPDLQIALDWREQHQPNQAWAQRYFADFDLAIGFLEQSRAAREAEAQRAAAEGLEKEERRKRELRRTRLFVVVLAAAFLLSLVTTVFALQQRGKALRLKEEAERQTKVAEDEKARADQKTKEAEDASVRTAEQARIAGEEKEKADVARLDAEKQANLAERQKQAAELAGRLAEEQRQLAFSRQLAAQSEKVLDASAESLELSTLLAAEALRSPTLEADQALRKALMLLPRTLARRSYGAGVQNSALSPDGTYLATVSNGKTVQIWNAATGERIGKDFVHEDSVEAVVFNPDGKFLATQTLVQSGREQRLTAQVWDVAGGNPVGAPIIMTTEERRTTALAISPDGQHLALTSGKRGAVVQIRDAKTGQPIGLPLAHEGEALGGVQGPAPVSGMSFNQDGTLLATICGEGGRYGYHNAARIWKVATGKLTGEPLDHGRHTKIEGVAFSPDSQYLATISYDRIRVWDLNTRQEAASVATRTEGAAIAFSPDKEHLAAALGDSTARLWKLKRDSSLSGATPANQLEEVGRMVHDSVVRSLAFNSDGTRLSTITTDGVARVWETRGYLDEVRMPEQENGFIRSIAFSSTGKRLATAGLAQYQSCSICVWELPGGEALKTLGKIEWGKMDSQTQYQERRAQQDVVALTYSPDERLLATASKSEVRIWNAATGALTGASMQFEATADAVAFSPNGKYLALAAGQNVMLREAFTGRPAGHPMRLDAKVKVLVFSADGRQWAAAGDDNTVRVVTTETGRLVGSPMRHNNQVRAVAFSPDGNHLATTSLDERVRIWGVAAGRLSGEPIFHAGEVDNLAFSPDGKHLAIAGRDGVVIWDLASQQKVARLPQNYTVKQLAFSADGKYLAVATEDAARLWLWRPEDLIRKACSRLNRGFTGKELESYFGGKLPRQVCDLPAPAPKQ